MRSSDLERYLEALRNGDQSIDDVVKLLRDLPYQELGLAGIGDDCSTPVRMPQMVLGKGRSPEQISESVASLAAQGIPVLVTKTGADSYEAVRKLNPNARFNQSSGTITVPEENPPPLKEGVTVVTAGTADIPVAEEAALTAELMGNRVERINDVGVAGLHRLVDALPKLREARVMVVVAGMDAALAAVVAGLVSMPVVAVPTSQGYGASFEGLAPLLSMLNSCAPGVAVVNIDNGFGAGYMAAKINQMARSAGD